MPLVGYETLPRTRFVVHDGLLVWAKEGQRDRGRRAESGDDTPQSMAQISCVTEGTE